MGYSQRSRTDRASSWIAPARTRTLQVIQLRAISTVIIAASYAYFIRPYSVPAQSFLNRYDSQNAVITKCLKLVVESLTDV